VKLVQVITRLTVANILYQCIVTLSESLFLVNRVLARLNSGPRPNDSLVEFKRENRQGPGDKDLNDSEDRLVIRSAKCKNAGGNKGIVVFDIARLWSSDTSRSAN